MLHNIKLLMLHNIHKLLKSASGASPGAALRRAPKVLLTALTVLALAAPITSCSDSDASADASRLLRTVPADAPLIAVVDIESVAEDCGGKVRNDKVEKAAELRNALSQKGNHEILAILDGNSGIALTSAVIFFDGGSPVVTCRLDDPSKFREFVENGAGAPADKDNKAVKAQWTAQGDFSTCGKYTVKGDQLWIASGGVTPERIREFAALSDKNSFSSSDYATTLASCEHDIAWWGSIGGLIRTSGISFSDASMLRMASSMLFDGAESVAGYSDIEENSVRTTLDILNAKLKPARSNLKFGELNTAQIEAVGGNASLVVALSLPAKLVKQILKSGQSFGGTLPSQWLDMLKPVDGTVVFASDNPKKNKEFAISVATSGNQAPLMQVMYEAGLKPVSEGNLLKAETANFGNGAFSLKDAASGMKGDLFGIMASTSTGNDDGTVLITGRSNGAGLQIKFEITSANSSQPIFLDLLNL